MSLEREQHKCRIWLQHSTETISVHDQVAVGVSHMDITLKLTNQLKLDGPRDEPLHICVPCATTAKIAYNTKEPCNEADYKLEIEEEITIEDKVKTEKIEHEKVTENCSTLSPKEEIHNVSENEQTLEAPLEHVTIEEALEVYYDEPCDKTLNYRRKLRSNSRVVDKLGKSLNDYTKHVDAKHADRRTKNCKYCDKIFFDTQALKDHLRGHRNIKSYECEDCGSKFAWKDSLIKHLKRYCTEYAKENTSRSHTVSKKCKTYENKADQVAWLPFACKICDKKFGRTSSLRRHSKVAHNSHDKSCYFCAFLPKSPDELRKHITQEHADKKPWACKECGNTYFQENHLKLHLLTHKGIKGKHMCNVCDYKTHFKSVMVKHMRKHTGERPFSCSKCGRTFSSNYFLKFHMKSHEWGDSDTPDHKNENLSKSGAQKIVCKMCFKEFAHHSSLRKHSEGMHYIQISCYYCGYIPTSSNDSERHIRKEHSDKKYYACDQCDEVFFSVQNLKAHLLLHSDINNYDCKICNFKCKSKCYLIRHLRKHTGEKPFQCSNCGKAFREHQKLKIHITNQANRVCIKQPEALKIYACKFCDKTYNLRSNMRKHTRNVHKINDTSCLFCDYMPASMSDLRKHSEAEHADKKTISCEHCNKRFFENTSLKKHLAVHNTIGNHESTKKSKLRGGTLKKL